MIYKIDFISNLTSAKNLYFKSAFFHADVRNCERSEVLPMCKLISYPAKNSCIWPKTQDTCLRNRVIFQSEQGNESPQYIICTSSPSFKSQRMISLSVGNICSYIELSYGKKL